MRAQYIHIHVHIRDSYQAVGRCSFFVAVGVVAPLLPCAA